MKLLVGLGNPGKKYEQTWHNLGFMTLDQLATSRPEEFLKFKKNLRLKADVCEGTNPQEKLILVKPQTFMNKSGEAIKDLVNFYKIKPENLWVFHDDIDLPLGKIRISHDASAGGHKGVQSIIEQIGSQDFVRFRLGIQKNTPNNLPTETYVLQKIDKEAKVIIDEMIQKVISAIEVALIQGISEAMNEFN
ncbi:MAG TPA: aminoacyl-tRNA hydrolase [Patescibacteria group bacterium]|nr:aminoacyl-tRNA hydrolase [Patescibacteria group bacterium]